MVDVLQGWRTALEQEAAAAQRAQQELAQQRREWRARIGGVQQQFEAAQALLAVLEERGAAQKAEVAQVCFFCLLSRYRRVDFGVSFLYC